MDKTLLELGITGLAKTPEVFPGQWFHGHHGAAVLAAHFIRSEFSLDTEVDRGVEAFARRTVAKFPELFTGETDNSTASRVQPLLDELSRCLSTLRADVHDVIFATLALSAFDADPYLVTATRVRGVINLIRAAQADDPRRYFGCDDYIAAPPDSLDVPHFASLQEAAAYTFEDHGTVYPDQLIDGRYYFLAGNKLHDLTHLHALMTLDKLGHADLAARGIEPLRLQFHLSSLVPDNVEPLPAGQTLNPWERSFWRRNKEDAHQVKLAYAMMDLLQHLPDHQCQRILADISKYWSTLS